MVLPAALRGAWTATKLAGRSLKTKRGRKSLKKASGKIGTIGLQKTAKGVHKVKSLPKYTGIKSREKAIRDALGMTGKGKINRARRAAQGPIGYVTAGAVVFGGSNKNNDKYHS